MSSPHSRLLSDAAAGRFEQEASCLLAAAPLIPSGIETLAAAVVALVRDREARIELAAVERNGGGE